MKKSAYLLIAFAFAAAVSCVKEIAVPQEPETCTLTAEFADGDVETRTSISSDNKTRWVLDDKILINGSDATIITGTATSLQDNGRVAIFTMSKPVSGSGLYASYPSNLSYIIDGQKVENFNGSQLAGKTITSYTVSDDVHVVFTTDFNEQTPTDVKVFATTKPVKGATDETITVRGVDGHEIVYVIDGKVKSKEEFMSTQSSNIESMSIIKSKDDPDFKKYAKTNTEAVIMISTKK